MRGSSVKERAMKHESKHGLKGKAFEKKQM